MHKLEVRGGLEGIGREERGRAVIEGGREEEGEEDTITHER